MASQDLPTFVSDMSSFLMKINHVHLYVQELAEAIRWFEHIWDINVNFMNERIAAVFSFDQFSLILDTGLADTKATIGFQSDNCDRDYQKVVERGLSLLRLLLTVHGECVLLTSKDLER